MLADVGTRPLQPLDEDAAIDRPEVVWPKDGTGVEHDDNQSNRAVPPHVAPAGGSGPEGPSLPHTPLTIENLVQQLAATDPGRLRGALVPILAPLVRKAVRESLDDMMQRAAEARAQWFTWRGLRWRLEAWWTGRTFQDVVVMHAMVYRVQQVFLIHRETGLLLQYVAANVRPPVKEPDVVSGMLSAIQDFVRDSFCTRDGDALDALKVGELTVWVEHGALASIAVVLWGVAPEGQIRRALQGALGHIQRGQLDALQRFRGDVRPFAATRGYLQACLLSAE